jgi:PAS domain S-box-containing protein
MTKKNYGKLNVTLVQNLRRKISEIRGAEENFRMIFEGTRDGILVADNETRNFIMANPAICKMLGYTKEELLKLGITRIHPKKDLPAVIDAFEKQLRGELIIAEALPVLRKDGIVILCDITSAPIKINGKDVLMGVFKDVTEKKKAEEELKATEMRYKTLFDNIPFLSQSVTPEAKIVYVNRK